MNQVNENDLKTEVASLKTDLRGVKEQVAEVNQSVRMLLASKQTSWPLVIAIIFGVLSTIGGTVTGGFGIAAIIGNMAINGVNSDIIRLVEDQSRLEASVLDHWSNGHPHTVIEKIDALKERFDRYEQDTEREIEQLDLIIHREMQALDDTQASRIEALDHRLQREFEDKDTILKEMIRPLERAVYGVARGDPGGGMP